MRTLTLGWRSARSTPLALIPLTLEGLLAGVLVALGAFPADGAAAPAAAAFPLDLFFDVKQAIAFAPSWPAFVAAALLAACVRSLFLATTLWLSEDRRAALPAVWLPALRWCVLAVVVFVVPAALMFNGVAIRYAPFVWVAGGLGLFASVWIAGRGLRVDAGIGRPRGGGPGPGSVLTYAVVLSVLAACIALASRSSPVAAGAVVAAAGPLHALVLLAWRARVRDGAKGDEGTLVVVVAVALLLALFASALFDRYARDPGPRAGNERGALLLLGGADSTSDTGALTELDPRSLGFDPEDTLVLSYRGPGLDYDAADTRSSLDHAADRVAADIAAARARTESDDVHLLGHSQAALLLDRMTSEQRRSLRASAVVSAPPVTPPPVEAPRDGGPGYVGATLTRWLGDGLDLVGIPTYDVDAPASPVRLQRVVARDSSTPRLAVWALADSVWLDGDHRRPGESNIVAFSDHVGAVENVRTYRAVTRFFDGRPLADDDIGSLAVGVLRYAFEPWRPD